MNISENQEQFIGDMSDFKRDLISALNSENVERYREAYKGRYSPERFRELFIEKITMHTLFKYILIRTVEESMWGFNIKLSREGLEKWHEMSKNFREDYDTLFDIAVDDVRRGLQELPILFQETIYDKERFTRYIKPIIKEYIPVLSDYTFSSLNALTTITIIDRLYNLEKRVELQKLQPSPIINYLMEQLGLE